MEEQIFEQRTDLSALNDAVNSIRNEIKKIIVGQDEMVKLIITALLADGHVLIEGVPGVAKTLTAKLVAKSVNVGFSRIQFTPDLMPSDVLGTPVFNPKEASFANGIAIYGVGYAKSGGTGRNLSSARSTAGSFFI